METGISISTALDVTLNVRTVGGLTFQGGTSTGQTVADNCAVRANLPELSVGIGAGIVGSTVSPTSPYCHVGYGVLTQLRGLASYTIPKIDLQVSGVFQSKPGALLRADYAVPSAVVAQSLGRPPSGNVTNVTVNLIEPGTLYGDRLNQLDFRIAKILRFGGRRAMVGLDLYNVMNSSTVLTYNNAFVPGGTVAAAELDPDAAAGPDQRGVHLLRERPRPPAGIAVEHAGEDDQHHPGGRNRFAPASIDRRDGPSRPCPSADDIASSISRSATAFIPDCAAFSC